MKKIVDGVAHFRTHTHPNDKELYDSLAGGQSPRVLFITCSDSRIVPHHMTHCGPGDLFVIRNAGNLIPPFSAGAGGEEATMEYAVSALGVKHIIVCGHSDCGAMKGLLQPESLKGVPAVAKWLELARPAKQIVELMHPADMEFGDKHARAIETNVLVQLDNLKSHPSVAAALATDDVQLHGWVFDIGSGAVRSYDESQNRFIEIAEDLIPLHRHLKLAV